MTNEQRKAIWDALSLMNSMIQSGQQHSESSRQMLDEAYTALASDEAAKPAMVEVKLYDAINWVAARLSEDKEPGSYYDSWKANIAMCMLDEFNSRQFLADPEIINAGAVRFLELLTKQPTQSDKDYEKEYKLMKEKAAKWDELESSISKCYVNEDGSENTDENIDLCTIGEIAASAFNFL